MSQHSYSWLSLAIGDRVIVKRRADDTTAKMLSGASARANTLFKRYGYRLDMKLGDDLILTRLRWPSGVDTLPIEEIERLTLNQARERHGLPPFRG